MEPGAQFAVFFQVTHEDLEAAVGRCISEMNDALVILVAVYIGPYRTDGSKQQHNLTDQNCNYVSS